MRMRNVQLWITVEEWNALLAMLALSIVLAVIADTATDTTRVLIDGVIKVTACCVTVAVAHLTGIRLLAKRRFPGQIIEKVLALFAVQTLGVVRTLATSMHHLAPGVGELQIVQRQAAVSVTIARARTSDDHLGNRVVIFLPDLLAIVQQIVTQCVQLGEVDTQVGHLQHVLDVFRIGILDVHVRW